MEKYVRDSYTEQVQILSQSSLNGYKRLFGGRLMEWIGRGGRGSGPAALQPERDHRRCGQPAV